MNLPDFQSSLADPLRRFLQFKQALNRKYRTEAATLRLFDAYLCKHNATDWQAIDSAMIDELVDVAHFVANLATAAGCTDEEWTRRYQAKMQINRDRQASGSYGRIGNEQTGWRNA